MVAHRFFIPLWIALGLAVGAARAVTVEQIPSPRPNGWAVDLTGTLPAETLAQLDSLGAEVKAQTGAELAVVVVGTVEGANHRDFATRLFNRWGIGQRGKDNGLLVFAALDDRAAEIVLGNGIDSDAEVRASQAIMDGEMVPRFREGDPAGALLQGARACAQRILHVQTSSAGIPQAIASPAPDQAPQPLAYAPGQEGRPGNPVKLLLALLFGGGAASLLGFLLLQKPKCRSCKTQMTLMDEAADDAHLQPAEQTEERVGSMNHQVWFCSTCGLMHKSRRSRFFSGYGKCPGCSAKTLRSTTTTLRSATYTSEGRVRVNEVCAHCSHTNTYIRSTPRLQRSRSSGGGSGFSGGRSSGRGASGRW